jgi:membrane protein DedA with SNARE-associated domain
MPGSADSVPPGTAARYANARERGSSGKEARNVDRAGRHRPGNARRGGGGLAARSREIVTAPPLPGVLASLAPLLDHYGYLAIAALVTLEDFGIPVPGETVLIAGAVYAGAGRLNIAAVGIIAVAAAVIGDNIGYLIGRPGGRALVLRYGRYVFLTGERLARAEAFFTRHGGKVVTIARFLEGLRQANGIIAGITGMPWRRFLAFNALGAVLWAGLWASLGDLAGQHIGAIYAGITRYSLYALAALPVAILVMAARRLARRRAARQPPASRQREPTSQPCTTADDIFQQ